MGLGFGCDSSTSGADLDVDAGRVLVPAPDASVLKDGLCTSCDACELEVKIASEQHVAGNLIYEEAPPAGGDHNVCWAPFGVHDEPVPDERWVHNLEHGAVVYLHNCPDGCAAEVKALNALAEGRPFALITPYADLPTRFAAISWGHKLLSDCFDVEVFKTFYTKRVDQGPESVSSGPPGSCH